MYANVSGMNETQTMPGARSAQGTCTVHLPQTSLPMLFAPEPSSFVYELPNA